MFYRVLFLLHNTFKPTNCIGYHVIQSIITHIANSSNGAELALQKVMFIYNIHTDVFIILVISAFGFMDNV